MTKSFRATEFSAIEETWGYLTVLGAPSTEEEDFYLMLQRPYTYSKDAVQWGQDKPYIEFCSQGQSWYGHIESFRLLRDRVLVRMDQTAASEMRNDGNIEVIFDLDDKRFAELKRALHNTFQDVSYFEVV
jgi:hypothetical protein